MEICPWCQEGKLSSITDSVYWELPDGTRAVEITETPTKICNHCSISFQSDEIVKQIEDQLFLINTKQLNHSTSFGQLMKMERLLKRNYFDFG